MIGLTPFLCMRANCFVVESGKVIHMMVFLVHFFFFLSLIFKQRIVNIILLPIYVHKEMSNSTKKEKREEPE